MTDLFATLTVRDFGAEGDGRTDDTSAFQSALSAREESGGGKVFAPTGSYRIDGSLRIGEKTTLRGAGAAVDGYGEALTMSGNHFSKSMNRHGDVIHVAVREGTRSAAIFGNVADKPWRSVNEIGERAEIGFNTVA